MEKSNIVRFDKPTDSFQGNDSILDAIDDAKKQWEAAELYFESATEPKLVDYAIFMEQAAKIRLAYLLEEAKKRGIKVQGNILTTVEDIV